jgi:hypothetical protein
MFECDLRPCEFIFSFLGNEKCDMEEFAELIFLVVKWSWELIICILDVLKCAFGDDYEVMLQGVERLYDIIFYLQGK